MARKPPALCPHHGGSSKQQQQPASCRVPAHPQACHNRVAHHLLQPPPSKQAWHCWPPLVCHLTSSIAHSSAHAMGVPCPSAQGLANCRGQCTWAWQVPCPMPTLWGMGAMAHNNNSLPAMGCLATTGAPGSVRVQTLQSQAGLASTPPLPPTQVEGIGNHHRPHWISLWAPPGTHTHVPPICHFCGVW